jgi:hypothetical protein
MIRRLHHDGAENGDEIRASRAPIPSTTPESTRASRNKTKPWLLWLPISALVAVALFIGIHTSLNPSTRPTTPAAPSTSIRPGSPGPSASDVRDNAAQYEKRGFASLLAHNFDEAYKNFDEAARLYPDLHNVNEIRDLLIRQKAQLQWSLWKPDDTGAWKNLYSTILDKYSWGMPADVKAEMEAKR